MYQKIPINGQHEVIGMSGDIALYQGKPVVHTQMVVGSPHVTFWRKFPPSRPSHSRISKNTRSPHG
jgi:hypothetical protein